MQHLKKLVFLCVFAAAFLAFGLSVSANVVDYVPYPDYHNYPLTAEGYTEYTKDVYKWLAYNGSAALTNVDYNALDAAKEYFTGAGLDTPGWADVRKCFSYYYQENGSVGGGSHRTQRQCNDNRGGSFKIIRSDSGSYQLYHVDAYGNYDFVSHYSLSDMVDATIYSVSMSPDGLTAYIDWGVSVELWNGEIFHGNRSVHSYTFPEKTEVELTDVDITEPVGGASHGLHGHLEIDPDGTLYFVDDDGNRYPFGPDGYIKFPDGDYPFDLDLRTLSDDQLKDLGDEVENWALLMYYTIQNIKDSGCTCKDYTEILKYIAEQTHKINKNTDGVESLLQQILDKLDTPQEKEDYFKEISAIMLAVSNILPYDAIADGLQLCESILFGSSAPKDISFTVFGKDIIFVKSAWLTTFSAGIALIRNILGLLLLYAWLVEMRKKVTSV